MARFADYTDRLCDMLSRTFTGYDSVEDLSLPEGAQIVSGKVRDTIDLGDELLITTTDRISAFDRVLTTIPAKGAVLNSVSAFWFERTRDIVENHMRKQISPRSMLVDRCKVLPVEVIVRGYLTGSAWRDYAVGKQVSGITLPEGMQMNQAFDQPLLTPSTKAEQGLHDEPISEEELVSQGLVSEDLWQEVRTAALALFRRGSQMLEENGLILVDTKYEFGLLDDKLTLIDELHTPDSSRFWYADTYRELFEAGEKQRKLDKEYLRQWLMEQGFQGDGEPPHIPDEVRIEVANRYIRAYEEITGLGFDLFQEGIEAERNFLRS